MKLWFALKNNNRIFTILTFILVILLIVTGFMMNKNYYKHAKSGPSQSEKFGTPFGNSVVLLSYLAIVLMYLAIIVYAMVISGVYGL